MLLLLLLQPQVLKAAPGREGQGEESGSSGRAREAWTHRDIYIQSDRLPGIVSLRALMSDPLLPVQKGERHAMTMGPKQDKEEMFKFRPPSSTISSSTATAVLWSCLVFVNSFGFPPPRALSPPLCHFNRRIFTFNANPKGGSATETRVQSITCFH